ncbi:MAG TPA: LamG domain-containing protein [Fibrobacteria bacterium]|nr:LamG domain-containing protein [Fibrobacteria bacterium]
MKKNNPIWLGGILALFSAGCQFPADTENGVDENDWAARSVPFPSYLVGDYPFSGNAQDQSGSGNHGSVLGAVPAPDRHGHPNRAYAFDGSTDAIAIPHSPSLNITGPLTLAAWVRLDPADSNGVILSKYAPGRIASQQGGYSLGIFRHRISLALAAHDYFAEIRGESRLARCRFHHLAGVYDCSASRIYLYVDGVLDASFSLSPGRIALGPNTLPVLIGNKHASSLSQDGRKPFRGDIDDVQIFNRALS